MDRRLVRNQTGKRQCVVVIRERDGYVMPSAFATEGAASAYIRNHVAAGTEIMTDEATSWNSLEDHYAVKRINHQIAYSLDGACINGQRASLAGCAGPSRGITIMLPEFISPATPKRARAARVIAGMTTALRFAAWSGWR